MVLADDGANHLPPNTKTVQSTPSLNAFPAESETRGTGREMENNFTDRSQFITFTVLCTVSSRTF